MKMTFGLLRRKWPRLRGAAAGLLLWPSLLVGSSLAPPKVAAQSINTPQYGSGQYAQVRDAPCIPYQVGEATATLAMLALSSGPAISLPTATQGVVTGATGSQAAYAPAYVSWVLVSTGTTNQYVTLSDTGAVTASNNILSPIGAGGGVGGVFASTGAVLWSMNFVSTTTTSSLYSFLPPLKLRNGLRVQLSSATFSATVCYRPFGLQYP